MGSGGSSHGGAPKSIASSGMRDYRKLEAFGPAHALAIFVYREVTPLLPRSEKYGLFPQMRDAARSVPANLMEGCGRRTNLDFAQFVDRSTGSANELLYYGILCEDVGLLPIDVSQELQRRTRRMLQLLVALARGARSTPDPIRNLAPPRSTRRKLPARKNPPAQAVTDPPP